MPGRCKSEQSQQVTVTVTISRGRGHHPTAVPNPSLTKNFEQQPGVEQAKTAANEQHCRAQHQHGPPR